MRHKARDGKHYLGKFLKIAPLSHALWRSCEALAFQNIDFKKPVLDIGCGFGEFAGVAFNKIEVGIDINEDDLKKALTGKKYSKVLKVDARKMPFRSNTFNTAISVSVLEHIENTAEVIKETHRVLKKGGLFVFSVPTNLLYKYLLIPKIFQRLHIEFIGQLYFRAHCYFFKHQSLHSPGWWTKQLEKNGFEIMERSGTVSPLLLKLHEVFLVFALPSQLSKALFGKRLVISQGIRSQILPKFFAKYIELDKKSDINMFFVARKK